MVFMPRCCTTGCETGFADAKAYGIGLSFALSETPTSPELPERLRLREMPHSWMEAHRATDVFDNALGGATTRSASSDTDRVRRS